MRFCVVCYGHPVNVNLHIKHTFFQLKITIYSHKLNIYAIYKQIKYNIPIVIGQIQYFIESLTAMS